MYRILFFAIFCDLIFQSCTKQETVSTQAQFKSDTTSISSFVKTDNPSAIKMSTGFWYSIDALADGIYPVLSDSVKFSYTTKLIPTSQKVDFSAKTTVLLSQAIAGLQQGLILFPVGSSGRLYIPSGLAFGRSAHDTIPPNANLFYEIKLIDAQGSRFGQDTTTIHSYLQTHSIAALHDPSGIHYTIDTLYKGATMPVRTDSVLVTYSEKILTADTLTASATSPSKIALKDQVAAWRIMLPKYVGEGTTITMYVPSGFAYGSNLKQGIPANSNMTYVITLIKVN